MSKLLTRCLGVLTTLAALAAVGRADPPSSFDLRDVDGVNYVTPVKSQIGGTCWCFGTMGAFEGNVMMTGVWYEEGEAGWPDFAEYHLDWWSGFNEFNNDDLDPPTGDGLGVHAGGDYRVSAAYMTRGDGSVRNCDGQSYANPPPRYTDGFRLYYPRDIEWYVAGPDLSNINTIKNTIMTQGAIAMCMAYSGVLIENFRHYQPPDDDHAINHSLTIVGWDDNETTPAPLPGAWLVKNSWGKNWGYDGYFWVSYYDKHAAQHPEMGCVSFQNIELNRYDYTHYHDYHGWRDTKTDADEAFNAFVCETRQLLSAVSFYTVGEDVAYTVKIYDRFENGELSDELASQTGTIVHRGYHTIDLDTPIYLLPNDEFYIYVALSHSGQAYDCTGVVEEMMGGASRAIVTSAASPGESYYRDGDVWIDLTDYDESANFCIKGFAFRVGLEVTPPERFDTEGPAGGPFTPVVKSYQLTNTGNQPIDYEVTRSPCTHWVTLSGDTVGVLAPDEVAEVTVEINALVNALGSGLHRGVVYFTDNSLHVDDTTRRVDLIVGSVPLQREWTFDTDPLWIESGHWAWGQPHGGGGQCGYPDPTSGCTGDLVCGYNLWGDYTNGMESRRLKTAAIDCSELEHARLGFWRWLGVGPPDQDKARIHVKAGDGKWNLVWRNPTEITDSQWVYQEYDISQVADGQPEVYIRWTMGPTNDHDTYCGWNIDDVRILGFEGIAPLAGDLNGDCQVDQEDLEILLINYGSTTALPTDGDSDGDGDVDLSDLAALLGNYGCACPQD